MATKNVSKTSLVDYKPYSFKRQPNNDVYVDIIFQDEGIMSVPKTSGIAIVDLLNDAFKNGVKMTLKTISTQPQSQSSVDLEPEFKPNQMPREEEHPINRHVKRL